MTTRRSILHRSLAVVAGSTLLPHLSARHAFAQDSETLTVTVLGATGRTGKHVVDQLTERGHKVRGVSRSAGRQDARDGVEWVSADVRSPETLPPVMEGADAVIYAVGVDFTQVEAGDLYDVYDTGVGTTAAAAKRAGVKRMIHLSSAGRVRPSELPEEYRASMDSKAKGEAKLRESGIEYAISKTPGVWNRPGGEYGILLLQTELLPAGGPFMICREDSASVLVESAVTGNAANRTFTIMNAVSYEVNSWKSTLNLLKPD